MEQAAVDHAGEPLAPVTQRRRVFDQELHRQAPLGRLARARRSLLHEVDPGDPVAPAGEEQSVFASSAAGIENWAVDPVGDRSERPLRLADVPGCLSVIEVLEVVRSAELFGAEMLRGMVMNMSPCQSWK